MMWKNRKFFEFEISEFLAQQSFIGIRFFNPTFTYASYLYDVVEDDDSEDKQDNNEDEAFFY